MIKKPYLFFLFVLIGISIILFLLLTTEVPVINTYAANIQKSQEQYLLSCDEAIFGSNFDTIYLYKDKNEAMYKISNYMVLNENQVLVRPLDDSILAIIDETINEINVEMSSHNITLFEAIFMKGGKT